MVCSLQEFKERAEATLGLGVTLRACGGLEMRGKVGIVGSDSSEEEQRKEIRNCIPVNPGLIIWGKPPHLE